MNSTYSMIANIQRDGAAVNRAIAGTVPDANLPAAPRGINREQGV